MNTCSFSSNSHYAPCGHIQGDIKALRIYPGFPRRYSIINSFGLEITVDEPSIRFSGNFNHVGLNDTENIASKYTPSAYVLQVANVELRWAEDKVVLKDLESSPPSYTLRLLNKQQMYQALTRFNNKKYPFSYE